jgi:hypothetical protein
MKCLTRNKCPGVVWIILGCSFLLCQYQTVQAQRAVPEMRVRFEIHESARDYRLNYNSTQRAQICETVGDTLVSLCQDKFGFLPWSSESFPVDSAWPDLALVLLMVGQDRYEGLGQRITLRLYGILDSSGFWIPNAAPVELYEASELQPTSNQEYMLIDDIKNGLTMWFEKTENLEALQTGFLSAVPLTDSLIADTLMRRLVVPLPWDSLGMKEKSVFRVDFKSDYLETSVPTDGWILLQSETRWEERDIRCMVTEFVFPRIEFQPNAVWHDSLTMVLDGTVKGTLRVYMKIFIPDPQANAVGGLFMDLPDDDDENP